MLHNIKSSNRTGSHIRKWIAKAWFSGKMQKKGQKKRKTLGGYNEFAYLCSSKSCYTYII